MNNPEKFSNSKRAAVIATAGAMAISTIFINGETPVEASVNIKNGPFIGETSYIVNDYTNPLGEIFSTVKNSIDNCIGRVRVMRFWLKTAPPAGMKGHELRQWAIDNDMIAGPSSDRGEVIKVVQSGESKRVITDHRGIGINREDPHNLKNFVEFRAHPDTKRWVGTEIKDGFKVSILDEASGKEHSDVAVCGCIINKVIFGLQTQPEPTPTPAPVEVKEPEVPEAPKPTAVPAPVQIPGGLPRSGDGSSLPEVQNIENDSIQVSQNTSSVQFVELPVAIARNTYAYGHLV